MTPGRPKSSWKVYADSLQDSRDIEPSDLVETPLAETYAELPAAAEVQNRKIASAKKIIEKESLQSTLRARI